VEARPSFYSARISLFSTICLGAGLGISVGMIAGTTGLEGSARGRMTVLTAVIGLVVGYLVTSLLDGSTIAGAVVCAALSGFSCAVFSGVIAGATRRGGTGALTFLTIAIALVIAAVTVLLPVLAILPVVGLIWLAVSRSRRADRKHAGLRILR
jgi:hypothetical protein